MAKDEFQPFLDEIGKILKFVEENAARPLTKEVTPETIQEMKKLEEMVKQFKKIAEEELKESGKTPKTMKELPKKEQEKMKQYLDLGLNTVVLGAGFLKAQKEAGGRMRDLSKNTKKSIQKRKKKFRGIGGKENWTKT